MSIRHYTLAKLKALDGLVEHFVLIFFLIKLLDGQQTAGIQGTF